jgi:hypothetical protein
MSKSFHAHSLASKGHARALASMPTTIAFDAYSAIRTAGAQKDDTRAQGRHVSLTSGL